jgi:hypothetical protein
VWRKPTPVIDRDDVNAALGALFDIRRLLTQIRTILREDNDEEGTD